MAMMMGSVQQTREFEKDLEFGLYFLQTLRMSLELTKNPGVIVLGWSGWLGTPSSVGALSASFS